MSNYQRLFHVVDLKLDIEPSLTSQRPAAANDLQLDAWQCTQLVERSDEYLCTGRAYHNDIVK